MSKDRINTLGKREEPMRLNKRQIAFVVAGALAAPAAFADPSTVTLYGTLNVDFENVRTSGEGANRVVGRNRVSSNSSSIGLRGSENIGGGLKGIFQIESRFTF